MSRLRTFAVLGLGLTAGAAGHYLYAHPPLEVMDLLSAWHGTAPAVERKVLYYRDPSAAPYWSSAPKTALDGRAFVPVYDDDEPSFDPLPQKLSASAVSTGERKVLYYRNPMGLPDTSPVPKKDTMGMDYIPVYRGRAGGAWHRQGEPRQGPAHRREDRKSRGAADRQDVRAVGRVEHDEALLTIVAMRSDGYIEDLFVNKTGQHVIKGDPLFRVYSPQIQ